VGNLYLVLEKMSKMSNQKFSQVIYRPEPDKVGIFSWKQNFGPEASYETRKKFKRNVMQKIQDGQDIVFY
jgi:hypothetical protein